MANSRGSRPRAEVGFLGRGLRAPFPTIQTVWGALLACKLPERGPGRHAKALRMHVAKTKHFM